MSTTYLPRAGVAETAKAIIRHPRFAVRFFEHFLAGTPDAGGADRRVRLERAAALQSVLLAMIDAASGAPHARRRLAALAGGPERRACALSVGTAPAWVASLRAAVGAIDPALPAETRERIDALFEAQTERLVAHLGAG